MSSLTCFPLPHVQTRDESFYSHSVQIIWSPHSLILWVCRRMSVKSSGALKTQLLTRFHVLSCFHCSPSTWWSGLHVGSSWQLAAWGVHWIFGTWKASYVLKGTKLRPGVCRTVSDVSIKTCSSLNGDLKAELMTAVSDRRSRSSLQFIFFHLCCRQKHEKGFTVCCLAWHPSGSQIVYTDIEGRLGLLDGLGTDATKVPAFKCFSHLRC